MEKEQKIKEFGVAKWFVFPGLTIALSSILINFNIKVFGFADSLPYIAMILMVMVFSVMICKFTSSKFRHIRITAYGIELVLMIALGVSAAYCFSVQREMTVADKLQQTNVSIISEISKLDRRAQRAMSKNVELSKESSMSVFKEYERMLFWMFIGEFFAYATGGFVLLGMTHLYISEYSETSTKFQERSETLTKLPETSKKRVRFSMNPARSNYEISGRARGSDRIYNPLDDTQWFVIYRGEKGTRIYNETGQYMGFMKPASEPRSMDFKNIQKFLETR